MKIEHKHRQFLPESRRVVVKIGTRVIAQRSGRPDLAQLRQLVAQVTTLRRKGIEVVVVTSGAVGAGMEALGIRERPTVVPDLQMCAAVGQARLMAHYARLFFENKLRVGQLLLTHDDFNHRVRSANARRTLEHLLRAGVVPVINENDVVADEELKADLSFGDNDYLAALVVKMIRADLLVILTTVNGVLRRTGNGAMRRITCIEKIGPEVFKLINPGANALSKGGMDSKLRSAQIATRAGCAVVIGNGRQKGTL
ncbi:MAG: glutamate 5-kinase, partial [Kiritimatiellae bacterium]|nr:glutamate 5-kinase [Kiritimatiellia bacterium]